LTGGTLSAILSRSEEKQLAEDVTVVKRTFARSILLCGAVGCLAAACASTSVLSVNYQLPARPAASLERALRIGFEDGRPNKDFLTPSALSELKAFSNVFALTVSDPLRGSDLKGAYDLEALFMEILRTRLEAAGVRVAPADAAADAELKFVLKEFRLDYGDRKWTTTAGYDAQLVKDGRLLSRQEVSGSAERLRVMGKSDAEKVVGELVSDTVNRLDLPLLFKQAGW
jgi:hypothetical protein